MRFIHFVEQINWSSEPPKFVDPSDHAADLDALPDLDNWAEPPSFVVPPKLKPSRPDDAPSPPELPPSPKKPKTSGGTVKPQSKRISKQYARVDESMRAMLDEAAKLFGDIIVTSGVRSRAEQFALIDYYTRKGQPKRAVHPDKSPHVQVKSAVDVGNESYKSLGQMAKLFAAISIAGVRRIGIYDTSFHLDLNPGDKVFISSGGGSNYRFLKKHGLIDKHIQGAMSKLDLDISRYKGK